ncbi:HAMP domain-containing protein [Carboxylicivirga sediminis]|uniref:HAMP domain-containing protein n=1 Tax=Carboxylicivirga sediminis TaxID=2006564 RepID=A0A941J038_9BACT|nr:methyl-accepting chemotaxis protein [Carboxylicivirga sediminis]MBR8537147.1 HAMP domain-containing protein [Carboxylicivirga sediminis]
MSLKRKLLLLVILPVLSCGVIALLVSSMRIYSQGIDDLENKSNSILDLYTMHFLRYHTDGSMSEDNAGETEDLLEGSYEFRIVSQEALNKNHQATAEEVTYENTLKENNLQSLKVFDDQTSELRIIRPVYYSDELNCAFCHNQGQSQTALHAGDIRGLFIVSTSTEPVYKSVKSSVLQISAFTLCIIVIAIFISFIIIRRINNSFKGILQTSKRIANGDLTVDIDAQSNDELGEIGKSLHQMIESIRKIVTSITTGANNIAVASEELSISSTRVSEAATQQASSLEEVSASMEEMLASIQQNTANSDQTRTKAAKAAQSMVNVSNSTDKSLNAIQSISSKIGIINDIANQTNILALNAAVESARAGSAGRGFAVVANEVKNLAELSKSAAEEIVKLSGSSVEVSEEAVRLVSETIPEIERTAELMHEVYTASNEQNVGSEQINAVLSELNRSTQVNAETAEELTSNAEELKMQAQEFKQLVAFFKLAKQ